ncbi:MAG TPA: acetylesterase [Candidatus Scybalocola faecigallinarum]|uniref:Acetylesterase n=1 Tax=Candidatus Scybalocola faecigallinarum TaxID=2840941 RepID=A0A9D1JRY1_9FIRM|nr:acetylesterase [Candidatus Scybalocola faecigallinarum]
MATFFVNFFSDMLKRTVSVNVILPTDKFYFPGMPKREEGKPYKTLYLLHGVLGNNTDWLHGTRIQRWAEEKDLAVVMPSGDNAFYVDQPWNCNYYSRFIGEELVTFTRKTFPLSHKREDTYIAGLSMGGYGAIYNGLKYHDTFGYIGALSAALVVNEGMLSRTDDSLFFAETRQYAQSCFGQDLKAAVESDVNPKVLVDRLVREDAALPKIFMACGLDDGLLAANEDFAEYLKQKGVSFKFETAPGAHEWDFWDTYIKKILDWLPLEGRNQGMNSGNVGI